MFLNKKMFLSRKKFLNKKIIIVSIVVVITAVLSTNFIFSAVAREPVSSRDLRGVDGVAAIITAYPYLKVRLDPYSGSEVIGKVYRNEGVKIISVDRYGWARIVFSSTDPYNIGRPEVDIGYIDVRYAEKK